MLRFPELVLKETLLITKHRPIIVCLEKLNHLNDAKHHSKQKDNNAIFLFISWVFP